MIRSVAVAAGAVVVTAASLSAGAQLAPPRNLWRCLVPPVESCFVHRGQLSTQNGVAYVLWLIGTNRLLRVTETEFPEMLSPFLDMTSPTHADIFGKFEICPLEPDKPGHRRTVCVATATRLVVQDRERTRPSMQLRSTRP